MKERLRLISALRTIAGDGHLDGIVPMHWCVDAASEAIKTIIRKATIDAYKGDCEYCHRHICHRHKWSDLVHELIMMLPEDKRPTIEKEVDDHRAARSQENRMSRFNKEQEKKRKESERRERLQRRHDTPSDSSYLYDSSSYTDSGSSGDSSSSSSCGGGE